MINMIRIPDIGIIMTTTDLYKDRNINMFLCMVHVFHVEP